MTPVLLYVLLGIVALGLVVGGGVAIRKRSSRELEGRTTGPALPGAGDESDVDAVPALPDSAELPTELPSSGTDTAVLERPESSATRMQRLRSRLAGSHALGRGLLTLLSRGELTDGTWDEIEETLLLSDLGVGPTTELMDQLRTDVKVHGTSDPEQIRQLLRKQLLSLVDPTLDRSLNVSRNLALDVPAVAMVVGVNGTGKTTTTGKLARLLVADDDDVLLAAADTFRAAAANQLTTWGQRVGVPVVRGPEGGDPASVAFDAVKEGIDQEVDVVLIDTAGRLHTKVGLMDELGKVKRVVEKQAPVTETLLVLDATTGQNGLAQARVFADVVDITGVVLTKLDGSAKGGIVVAIQRELGVPVKLVGLGEGPDDLAPFNPDIFVDALLGTDSN